MTDNIETLILTQLREMHEEDRHFREATRKELAEVKNLVGDQGVLLASIAGYIHEVEERVEALEGRDE